MQNGLIQFDIMIMIYNKFYIKLEKVNIQKYVWSRLAPR